MTKSIIYLKPVETKYWSQGDAWAFKISFVSFITDDEILAETISSYYRAEISSKYSAIVSVSKDEVRSLDGKDNLIIDINPDFDNVYMSWLELISDSETSIDFHFDYVHYDEFVSGELSSRTIVFRGRDKPYVLRVSEKRGCYDILYFLDEEGDYLSDKYYSLTDLICSYWDLLEECKGKFKLNALIDGWSEAFNAAYDRMLESCLHTVEVAAA